MTGKTTTGGYNFDPNAFSSDYGSANFEFSDLTPVPEPAPVGFTSLPSTGMTAIPGYTTPLPTTFGNDWQTQAKLATSEPDRAFHYESSGSKLRITAASGGEAKVDHWPKLFPLRRTMTGPQKWAGRHWLRASG